MSFSFDFHDNATPSLDGASADLQARLASVSEALAASLLSRARMLASGVLLHEQSGRYVAGLHASVRSTETGVDAFLSNDSPNAAILEFGATIPAHDILPNVARALRFNGGAGAVYAAVVHDPGARIGPHPVLETALADMESEIVGELTSAGLAFTNGL